MAYRDFDDPSRYSSRRYEPNTSRSRDFDHVKSTRYSSDRRRTEYHAPDQRARYSAQDYDGRYSDDYAYAHAYDRDRYPPTPPPTASYRIERRRKRSWPPPPTVEELADALAKEARVGSVDVARGDEAPNRGAVDQEPVLIEVEDEIARFNQERRFVLVPGSGGDAERRSDQVPIRKSAREPADRQRAPPLQTDLRDPPVHSRRAPSPYSYKPSDAKKERYPTESLLSPDYAAPSSSFRSKSDAVQPKSKPTHLQADSLFASDNVISDGSDVSADESLKLRSRRKPARYSFSPADLKKDDLRTSIHNTTPPSERVSSPYSYTPSLKKEDLRTPLSASVPSLERVSSPYSFTPAEAQKDGMNASLSDSDPVKERVSSPYSFSPADAKKEDLRNMVRDRDPVKDRLRSQESGRPASPPTSTPRSTPKSSGSSAGNTPSSQFFSNDLPWSRPKPTRQGTYETLYGSAESRQPSAKSSKSSSRPSSPLPKETLLPPSPPRSPRLKSQDENARVRIEPRSRPGSRGNSRANSPLVDYADPQSAPIEGNTSRPERVSTFPLSSSPMDRPRPASRHSRYDSAFAEDSDVSLKEPPPRIDVQSPSPARAPSKSTSSLPYPTDEIWSPSKSTSALPYPVDDGPTMMPSEEKFQFQPDSPRSPVRTNSDYQRGLPKIVIPSHVREDIESGRSPLRRTLSDSSARKDRIEPRSIPEVVPEVEVPREPMPDLADLPPLLPCPRSGRSSKHDDWYTLDRPSNLDICPDCFKNTVARTPLRHQFVRARPAEKARKCDFSCPWFRLAWLLTIKQKREDLELIRYLASVSETEQPCPGENEAVQIWYGLPNKWGTDYIPNFYVCERDLLYLEVLMPSLRGYFRRVDSSSPRRCSLRTSSRRFSQYLDTLLEAHEESLKSRSGAPDLGPFIELAAAHAWKRECPRDTIILNTPWHHLPGLPEFTVCEECYEDVVWPAVKRSKLADSVTRTLQWVPGGGDMSGEGNSCQLYSDRMRRIWARAVREDDFEYLADKVRERRSVQAQLTKEYKVLRDHLEDMMRDLDAGYSYGSGFVTHGNLDPERIRQAMDQIQREWKDYE